MYGGLISSSLLNAVKTANAGTYKKLDPTLSQGSDPEVFARTFHLQAWTTIRGDGQPR